MNERDTNLANSSSVFARKSDVTLLSNTVNNLPMGLSLIRVKNVGNNVSSVTVNSVFTGEYDNYLITWTGGVGSVNAYGMNMRLGNTTTGYYNSGMYVPYNGATGVHQINNGSQWEACGIMTTSGAYVYATILQPTKPRFTYYFANYAYGAVGGGGGTIANNGYLNNTTQYSGFTIFPGAGTITGGVVLVYGYNNAL
jgi:hypothetical protein